mgnify:FL=1
MAKRKETVWSLVDTEYAELGWAPQPHHSSDVVLTFTRKGIEINAWYDSCVGIGPTTLIPWEYIDAQRTKVLEKG